MSASALGDLHSDSSCDALRRAVRDALEHAGGEAGSFQTSMARYVAPCGVTSVYVWAAGDAQNHRTLSGDDHCR